MNSLLIPFVPFVSFITPPCSTQARKPTEVAASRLPLIYHRCRIQSSTSHSRVYIKRRSTTRTGQSGRNTTNLFHYVFDTEINIFYHTSVLFSNSKSGDTAHFLLSYIPKVLAELNNRYQTDIPSQNRGFSTPCAIGRNSNSPSARTILRNCCRIAISQGRIHITSASVWKSPSIHGSNTGYARRAKLRKLLTRQQWPKHVSIPCYGEIMRSLSQLWRRGSDIFVLQMLVDDEELLWTLSCMVAVGK